MCILVSKEVTLPFPMWILCGCFVFLIEKLSTVIVHGSLIILISSFITRFTCKSDSIEVEILSQA